MEPDEILDAINKHSTTVEVAARQAIDAVRRAHAEGRLNLGPDALPIFLLGIVGGAIGVRFVKGTLGLAVAAGLGYWAWTQLSSPALDGQLPKQKPSIGPELKSPNVRIPGEAP